jgi:hypothetical protein
MGFTAMAFLWTGSQIPVYLFGIVPSGTTPFSGPNCSLTNMRCRWHSAVYLWRYWRLGSLDLVCMYALIRPADESSNIVVGT